jgi:adenylate cyclase class 2
MEIEAKFLEIDPTDIEEKLKKLGAQKVFDKVFKEWIFQAKGDRQKEWEKTFKRIRIRDQEDKVFMTLKENKKFGFSDTEEIEFEVSSADEAREFLEKSDISQIRFQEKRRVHFKLDNIDIEIDYWPQIPPLLEIEADSEAKVRAMAKELGLDFRKAVFVDARQVYKRYYHIDIMKMKELKF